MPREIVSCPHCAKKLTCSSPATPGQLMRCHGCGQSFTVSGEISPRHGPAWLLLAVASAGIAGAAGTVWYHNRTVEAPPVAANAEATPEPTPPAPPNPIQDEDHLRPVSLAVDDEAVLTFEHPHASPLVPFSAMPVETAKASPEPPMEKPPAEKPPTEKPSAEKPLPTRFDEMEKRLLATEQDLKRDVEAFPDVDISSMRDVRLLMKSNISNFPPSRGLGVPPVMTPNGLMAVNGVQNGVRRMLRDERAYGLPVRGNSMLNPKEAISLKTLSADIRKLGTGAAPGAARFTLKAQDSSLDDARATAVRNLFETWHSQNLDKYLDLSPTLVQMLQVEEPPARLLLVQELSRVKTRGATLAIASRAVFDLSADVRQAAIEALKSRNADDYRPMFLYGLRYPWTPAADHAAEALIALADRKSVPTLVDMLVKPDPTTPVLDTRRRTYYVPEVVKINHLANCYLCHAPSFQTTDPIRGLVPTPGQPLPVQYYEGQVGEMVRADVTYLREDFSIMLPVSQASPWPETQRFDFLVRMRELKKDELPKYGIEVGSTEPVPPADAAAPLSPYRQAIVFALTRMTGKDLGADAERWRSELGLIKPATPPKKS